ncbi:hypothetical protein GGX14DRAFT_172500 [Mycena pura]|uniref:Uncharacterized protein n=1 Tax=Mycena pura TaxID=153505 RepID=A0AAD6Y6S5_9AGAR|nr:hypothetical protein GGX14DRAFT_172500 [Mycena pura]
MPPSFEHTVNPDQATFLGLGLEGIAYGVNLVLFGTSIAVLVNRQHAKNVSSIPIYALCFFMFGLCTVHFALNFNNVYTGTMVRPVPHIAAETHLLVGADVTFCLADFLSQVVLIYRCYLVWARNIWVVILPLLIAFASVACSMAVIGLVVATSPTAPQAPADIVPFGDAAFSMSVILNLITSSLIVGRIWWVVRNNHQHGVTHGKTAIQRAIEVMIESGLLLLATQVVFVVLFGIAHPAQAVVEPLATQIYVTAPMLIIVRVGMGAGYERTMDTSGRSTTMRFIDFMKSPGRGTGTDASAFHTDTTATGPRDIDMELSPYSRGKSASSKGTDIVHHAV